MTDEEALKICDLYKKKIQTYVDKVCREFETKHGKYLYIENAYITVHYDVKYDVVIRKSPLK